VWQHKHGGDYIVVAVANEYADAHRREEYPVLVVYKRVKDGSIWARKLASWLEDFM
jgi:hypothetical protein